MDAKNRREIRDELEHAIDLCQNDELAGFALVTVEQSGIVKMHWRGDNIPLIFLSLAELSDHVRDSLKPGKTPDVRS